MAVEHQVRSWGAPGGFLRQLDIQYSTRAPSMDRPENRSFVHPAVLLRMRRGFAKKAISL